MKNMKVLYKKEKGVSPVIATILMVAITVVLASAVYLMVSGYIGSAPSKPIALGVSPSTNNTATQFLITSGNITVNSVSPLIITISPPSGSPVSITLTSVATPSTQPSTSYAVHVFTPTPQTKYLTAGVTIAISAGTGWTGPLSPGTTVTFTYNGNVIYKYTA
jgi:flagellin-like protein